MSVDIGSAIGDGFERTVARNGLLLVAATFVLGVINGLVTASFAPETPGPGPGPGMGTGTDVPFSVSPGVGAAILLVVGILSLVVSIVALRTFVSDETESLPEDAVTRNMGWALVNIVVGGIVFVIVVGFGFLFLVVPGLFLLVSLYFWSVFVAVGDENFIEGFGNSWSLTKGNRIPLFALGLLVVVIAGIVNVVFSIPGLFLGGGVDIVISQLGSAFATVFVVAVTGRAYVQLRDTEGEDVEADENADPSATI